MGIIVAVEQIPSRLEEESIREINLAFPAKRFIVWLVYTFRVFARFLLLIYEVVAFRVVRDGACQPGGAGCAVDSTRERPPRNIHGLRHQFGGHFHQDQVGIANIVPSTSPLWDTFLFVEEVI
jgi:hypothetical protein